jgi:DNA replication initiation complex subunit (GINS family)
MSTKKTQPEEKGFFEKIKETIEEFWEGTKETAEDLKEKAEDKIDDLKEKGSRQKSNRCQKSYGCQKHLLPKKLLLLQMQLKKR